MKTRIALTALAFLCAAVAFAEDPASADEASAPDVVDDTPVAEADEPSFDAFGDISHRSLGAWIEAGTFGASDLSYGSVTTLSPTLRAVGDAARAEASLEAAVLTGAAASVAWTAGALPGATADLVIAPEPDPLAPVPPALFAFRVRTLWVKYDAGVASVQAGRQVVNFGRGLAFSPADVFASVDYSGLSLTRRGVDALRVSLPAGDLATVDLVAAPTATPDAGAYALRTRFYAASIDAALGAAYDGAKEAASFSADFKTDLVVGLYGEAALDVATDADPAFRGMAGADWSAGDFLFAGEYHYNGNSVPGDGPLVPTAVFPGAHNAYAAVSWAVTDFVSLSLSGLADLSWGLGSGILLCGIDAAQNAKLQIYARAANGSPAARTRRWSADAGLVLTVTF